MKRLTLAIVFLISGCVHVPIAPAEVSVVATPLNPRCGIATRELPVRLDIENKSWRKTLVFLVDSGPRSKPPYRVSWIYNRVLSKSSQNEDFSWFHGTGHDWVSTFHVLIGPHDSTQLLVPIFSLEPSDFNRTFMIELKDRDGTIFLSQPFKLCPGHGLTMRSSRTRFATQTTWQEKLAMFFAPLHESA